MSFPDIPNITPLISVTTGQTIPLLLSSIALEELALAHIMNAEAEKLQFVLGTLDNTGVTFSPAEVSLGNLLDVNTSAQRTLRDVIKKEMLLEFKFENVLDLIGASCSPTSATFTNPQSIIINGDTEGPASPYPSPINVSGLNGTIAKVTATLNNMSHTFPGDLDILLVGPQGQNVMLMSDAGGLFDIVGVTLTFDDDAATPVPTPIPSPFVSNTFQPTNIGAGDVLPGPAPGPPYGSVLSVFDGTNPNGTWNLFVFDDAGADSGTIAGGWSLTITTTCP